jgi:hypothetical protein
MMFAGYVTALCGFAANEPLLGFLGIMLMLLRVLMP